MNSDILRSFVEVARQESYTKAAEALYISQPTVYQHVRALEQMLGAPLIRQAGKRVTLTPEGKVALEQTIRVLSELNRLLSSALSDYQELRTGQVDLIVGTTFGQSVLPLGLAVFRRLYPGISVHTEVQHNPKEIDEALLRLGYDGAFHAGGRSRSGLTKIPILQDSLVLVTPPGHPLSLLDHVTAEQLTEFGIISYARPYDLRQAIETWAAEQSCAVPTILELNSQIAMATAVSAGAGVAILSMLAVRPFVESRSIAAIPLSPSLHRPWFFVHRSETEVSPGLTKLVELLKEAGSEAQEFATQALALRLASEHLNSTI